VIAKRFITGLVGAGLVAAATTGLLAGTASAAPAAANVQTASNAAPSAAPRIDAKAVDTNRNGRINEVTVKNTGPRRISVRVVLGRVNKTQNVDPGKTITVRDPQDRASTATVTASEGRNRPVTKQVSVPAPRGGRH
jgi:hypothetical protein